MHENSIPKVQSGQASSWLHGTFLPNHYSIANPTCTLAASPAPHLAARPPQCSASSPSSSSGGSGQGEPRSGKTNRHGLGRKAGKARQPGLFEISIVAPPPRSLGIFALPPLTHNGEMIEVVSSGGRAGGMSKEQGMGRSEEQGGGQEQGAG